MGDQSIPFDGRIGRSRLMGDRYDGSGKSSQGRQRSASKVVTESSAFRLESRHRVVASLCRDLLVLLTSINCQSSPSARNLPPVEIAHSAKWRLEATCTTTF